LSGEQRRLKQAQKDKVGKVAGTAVAPNGHRIQGRKARRGERRVQGDWTASQRAIGQMEWKQDGCGVVWDGMVWCECSWCVPDLSPRSCPFLEMPGKVMLLEVAGLALLQQRKGKGGGWW
jgi:hypothetical protein